MKLVFIFGSGAVGKMTTGQELSKITDLRLFHNHMTIEPVIEIFGKFDMSITVKLRHVIFEEFAKSDNYGMIYTMIMAFNMKEDWEYLEQVKDFFRPYNTEFYYVELIAPQSIRLERNTTENRLLNKASKRDIEASRARLLNEEEKYRTVSYDGEVPFENYLKIDNSNITARECAAIIKEHFGL